jgi:hypothetical protein
MVWAEAELRETIVKAWSYHGKRRLCPSAQIGLQAVRQSRSEGTALSGVSVVVAYDAAEALPAMHFTGPAPDLTTRVDEAIAQTLVVAFRVIVLQELARMVIRSCQGWRTKFMAEPMRLRRQA